MSDETPRPPVQTITLEQWRYFDALDRHTATPHELIMRDEIRAALAEIARLTQRVEKLRGFQYENLGYGKFRCRSCGSLKQVDYGDHETPTTERAEECSRNCPFNSAAFDKTGA